MFLCFLQFFIVDETNNFHFTGSFLLLLCAYAQAHIHIMQFSSAVMIIMMTDNECIRENEMENFSSWIFLMCLYEAKIKREFFPIKVYNLNDFFA